MLFSLNHSRHIMNDIVSSAYVPVPQDYAAPPSFLPHEERWDISINIACYRQIFLYTMNHHHSTPLLHGILDTRRRMHELPHSVRWRRKPACCTNSSDMAREHRVSIGATETEALTLQMVDDGLVGISTKILLVIIFFATTSIAK